MAYDFNDFPVFRGLNATQVENFVAACQDVTRQPGEKLIREGEKEASVYFLFEGRVRILVRADGGTRELAEVSAPAVLGEMEFLTGKPRSATVETSSEVRALEIGYDALRARIGDGDPATLKVFFNVSSVLANRLAAMDKKLSEIELEQPERTADLEAFQRKLYGEWSV